MAPIVQILNKRVWPGLFSLSLLRVSLVMANEWEDTFFWPIAVSYLCCDIHTRLRQCREGAPSGWGGIFCRFMWMYLTWGPSTWALASGCPPLFGLILLYVLQDRLLTAIGQKKASSHSLVNARDTRNRDREKSSGQTHLSNIWTIGAMDRTSGQPLVKLSLLRSISLKIWLLYCTVL